MHGFKTDLVDELIAEQTNSTVVAADLGQVEQNAGPHSIPTRLRSVFASGTA
jgi:hypothetical protein